MKSGRKTSLMEAGSEERIVVPTQGAHNTQNPLCIKTAPSPGREGTGDQADRH